METRRLLAASTVTLVASSSAPTYGDSLHFTAAVSSSDPGGSTPAGTVQFLLDGTPVGPAFPLLNGAVTTPDIASLPAGAHAVGAEYSGDSTFSPSTTTLPLTIRPAPLTIQADDKSKAAGAPNPPFTVTFAGFVSGEGPSNLGGSLTFATPATDASPPGQYPITPGGLTATNYAIDFVPGTITISPPGSAGSMVTLVSSSSAPTYGDSVNFTATIGGSNPGGPTPTGTVQFLLDGTPIGPAFPLAGGVVTSPGIATLPAGVHAIEASYSGDLTFSPSTATVPLTIRPATLWVNAVGANRAYGEPNPAFTASYAGFVLGQDAGVLGGKLTVTSPATTGSHAGQYPIIPGGLTASNYAITFNPGALFVTPAHLTIIADSKTFPQGQPGPLTASYVGFVNGDTPASLTTPPRLLTNATASSPPRTYPIIVQGASSPDYFISYVDGSLTIGPPAPDPGPPSAPVLSPASDTGVSNSDGITRNNGSADAPLVITVGGVSPTNGFVQLYNVTNPASPVALGSPVQASGGSAAFTLGGTIVPDGIYRIAATAAATSGGTPSALSPPTTISIQTSQTIVGTNPANGAVVTALPGGAVTIAFSHPLAGLVPGGSALLPNDPYDVMLIPRGPGGAFAAPSGLDSGSLPVAVRTLYQTTPEGTSIITLIPTAPLSSDVFLISVNLGDFTDLAGNPLTDANGGYRTFLLQLPPVSTDPLQVVGVTSDNGTVVINNNSIPQPDTIAIRFNKPLFAGAAGGTNVQLAARSGASYVAVPSVAAYSPTTDTIYLTPAAPLNPGTMYAVAVSGAVSDDQGYGGPGYPLGKPFYDSFIVSNPPAGSGTGPLIVAGAPASPHVLPQVGTNWPNPVGYVSVQLTEPLDLSSLGRYSVMLAPRSGGTASDQFDRADVPVNARVAFNPNTNQLIVVPSQPVGNDVYVAALGGMKAVNGDPLLNNTGQPAGVERNLPLYATFQVSAGGPSSTAGASVHSALTAVPAAAVPSKAAIPRSGLAALPAGPHLARPAQTALRGPRRERSLRN